MVNNLTNCVDSNAGTDYAVLALESLVLNKGDEPKFSQQSRNLMAACATLLAQPAPILRRLAVTWTGDFLKRAR